MSSLSEKVTSFVTHPLTGIVGGLYLTGGLCAIRKLDSFKDKNVTNKLFVATWLTGLVGGTTLILAGKTTYNALKND